MGLEGFVRGAGGPSENKNKLEKKKNVPETSNHAIATWRRVWLLELCNFELYTLELWSFRRWTLNSTTCSSYCGILDLGPL